MELSNGSYQRQLAAERKKTLSTQGEIRALQEELERLGNKLKVHMHKNGHKKHTDKGKIADTSCSNT